MSQDLVYYYCDNSTAVSILKNREIWMTSNRNLNDSNETIAVYKLFFDLLEKHDWQMNKPNRLFRYDKDPGSIRTLTSPLGAYPEYVTCFSQNSDLVSQWISYADNGQGVAIGFDEDEIKKIVVKDVLEYQKVTYVSESDILQFIPGVYNYLLEHIRPNDENIVYEAMEKLLQIFPDWNSYKTSHYESEQETRIIYNYPNKHESLPDGWEIKNIGVYAKRNLINTYVPLGFPESAIKEIVTGPKYQLNCYEVGNAMDALGYRDISIRHSNSGYR